MLSKTPPAERSTWIDTRPAWDGVSSPLGTMKLRSFAQAVLVFRSDVSVFAKEFSRRTGLSINAARIAVELHSEAVTLGRWHNYPRSDAFFQREEIRASKVYTKRRLLGGNDELEKAGFIDDWRQKPFVYDEQSAMRARPSLVHLVEDIINAGHRPYPHRPERMVEFRNADGETLKTPDTAQVREETRELNLLNWCITKSVISHACGVHLTRIYNVDPSMKRGGRCYAQGMVYQGWSRDRRSQIVIDGARNVECDYGSIHGFMLYCDRDLTPPSDCYDIDFWNRDLQKSAFNILINAANEDQAIWSLARKKTMSAHAVPGSPDAMAAATQLIGEMKIRHRAIADAFCSDAGAYLQKREADIVVEVMLAMRKRGETCLPVHDSIMCREWVADWLVEEMRKAADRAGLHGIRIEKVEPKRVVDEDAVEGDYPMESMGGLQNALSYSFLVPSLVPSFVESLLANPSSASQVETPSVIPVTTRHRLSRLPRVHAPCMDDAGYPDTSDHAWTSFCRPRTMGDWLDDMTIDLKDVHPEHDTSVDRSGQPEPIEVGLQSSASENGQKSALAVVSVNDPVDVPVAEVKPILHVTEEEFEAAWKSVPHRKKPERPVPAVKVSSAPSKPRKPKAKISKDHVDVDPFGTVNEWGAPRRWDGKMILIDHWPEIPF